MDMRRHAPVEENIVVRAPRVRLRVDEVAARDVRGDGRVHSGEEPVEWRVRLPLAGLHRGQPRATRAPQVVPAREAVHAAPDPMRVLAGVPREAFGVEQEVHVRVLVFRFGVLVPRIRGPAPKNRTCRSENAEKDACGRGQGSGRGATAMGRTVVQLAILRVGQDR